MNKTLLIKTASFFFAIALSAAISMPCHALGTASGTILTASSSLVLGNATASAVTGSNAVTVKAIYGFATASYSEEAGKTVSAGATATYDFVLYNNGNTSDNIGITLGTQNFSGTTGPTTEWAVAAEQVGASYLSFNNSGYTLASHAGDSATATAVPASSAVTFRLHNKTSASASDSAYSSYTVAFNTTNFPGAPYTGFNGITYAGPTVWARQLDSSYVITTVNGILVNATKSFAVAAPPTYVSNGGGATDSVPGASVTFTISFINNGGASALGVVVLDNLPANLTYAAGSILSCFSGAACSPVSDPDADNADPDCQYLSGTKQIQCNIPTLSSGGGGSLSYKATID